jgi:hypothetical protein
MGLKLIIFSLLIASGCSYHSIQKTTSPKGLYRAVINTNSRDPEPKSAASLVKLTMFKNDQEYLKDVVLEENEVYDVEWYNAYPDNTWVSESILRLGWQKDFFDTNPDIVYVENRTDKSIKYLELKARDIFLLFDVPAQSCIKLKSGHQSWQSWLAADGQFADGEETPVHGVNFYHKDKVKKPISYCITILAEKTIIESPDIEGYYGDNIVVPRSKECACEDNRPKAEDR